jgi:hypothetical protein
MEDRASELRRHAEHCRTLADITLDERMRTMLLTMAAEFDSQADEVDIMIRPTMPEA